MELEKINSSIKEKKPENIKHTFAPVYSDQSEILILGSFPSVKSRENGFYYGHPQNRFWKVISSVFQTEIPQSIEEKKCLLDRYHIALWDVIASCDIIGSDDNSIRNVIPNDICYILSNSKIKTIYANGKTAGRLYEKYLEPLTGRKINILPSTSPANAAYSLSQLIETWKVINQ